jgi:hypothetical protein
MHKQICLCISACNQVTLTQPRTVWTAFELYEHTHKPPTLYSFYGGSFAAMLGTQVICSNAWQANSFYGGSFAAMLTSTHTSKGWQTCSQLSLKSGSAVQRGLLFWSSMTMDLHSLKRCLCMFVEEWQHSTVQRGLLFWSSMTMDLHSLKHCLCMFAEEWRHSAVQRRLLFWSSMTMDLHSLKRCLYVFECEHVRVCLCLCVYVCECLCQLMYASMVMDLDQDNEEI